MRNFKILTLPDQQAALIVLKPISLASLTLAECGGGEGDGHGVSRVERRDEGGKKERPVGMCMLVGFPLLPP